MTLPIRVRTFSLATALMVAVALTTGTAAAAMTADATFDGDGLVVTKIGVGTDEARAIAVQEDGAVLVAGRTGDPDSSDMAVIRYLPDGSVDPTFSFSTAYQIGQGAGSDGVNSIQITADNKILLAGFATDNGSLTGAVVRLHEDGRLDYQFGDRGVVLFDQNDSNFLDMIMSPDGEIVVAGAVGTGDESGPFLVRFTGDGERDDTFGDDGVLDIADLQGGVQGLDAYTDGGLIGGGYSVNEQDEKSLLLVKITQDGMFDDSFGVNGVLTVSGDDGDVMLHDVGLLPDGRVIGVGEITAEDGSPTALISRFLEDGSPDTAFSDNGMLRYDIGEESGVYAVSVLESGVVLATGFRRDETGADTIVLRLESSSNEITEVHLPETEDDAAGSGNEITNILNISALQVEAGLFEMLSSDDPSVAGDAELITTELDGSDEQSMAVAATSDGSVYTAGSSGTELDSSILVTKYSTEDDTESTESGETYEVQPSEFYRVETSEVTDITRVSAISGGLIVALEFDSDECVLACEESCSEDDEDTDSDSETETVDSESDDTTTDSDPDCVDTCSETCSIPTVEKYGVVFSVTDSPEYESDADDDSSGDDDDTSTVSNDLDEDDDSISNPLGSDSLLNLDGYLVTEGQTDDGSGTGEYVSEMDEINPQTIYYVRAYALLSDGSVVYGEVREFRTKDSCFIATAAFGSIDGSAVRVLREFRDRYLSHTMWGRAAVGWYYTVSPPIAELVARFTGLRLAVAILLLPVVAWAWILLHLELVVAGAMMTMVLKFCKIRMVNGKTHE